jgi:hypothetical protein
MRRALLLLAVVAAVLFGPARAVAQTKTDKEMAELAKSIKAWLEGQELKGVALKPFSSSDPLPANGGPGLYEALRQALLKAGVKIDSRQKVTVTGTYRAGMDREIKRPALALQVKLVDANGKALRDFNRKVFGEQAILEAISPNVALAPDAEDVDREKAIVESLENPDAYVDGNRVFARKVSPYGVEILLKKGDKYEPLQPRLEKGLPYVSLGRDDVYAVRLINKSEHEAAVTLLIDGLHAMRFVEAREKDGKLAPFIVPANKAVTVRGWPISQKRSDEFLVTSYAKSAVAELNADKSKLGVITVQFAAAWEKGAKPPTDEQGGSRSTPRGGTGRGSPIDTPFKQVERTYGAVRAQVSIRYAK